MTVRHLLEQKGWNVWTISPDDTVGAVVLTGFAISVVLFVMVGGVRWLLS